MVKRRGGYCPRFASSCRSEQVLMLTTATAAAMLFSYVAESLGRSLWMRFTDGSCRSHGGEETSDLCCQLLGLAR